MEDITRKMTRAEARALTPELKKARRKAYLKAYNASPERRAAKKNWIKDYQTRSDIKAHRNAWNKASRASKKTHYVVYKHTSPEGSIYIGEGSNLRATDFYKRSDEYKAAFNKDTVKVEILHKFDTKKEAQIKEAELINEIGIENLINKNTPKAA